MTSRSSRSERRLILATANRAKAREMEALLSGTDYQIHSLADLPAIALPPEGPLSYVENALAKARAVAVAARTLALADDSGLEVDALEGRPGVLSARYGGEGLTDGDRCGRLLAELETMPPERRTARFRCVIALVDPSGREETVEGVVEGFIAPAPRGSAGFGYDPVFYYPPLHATFGELSPEVKNRVSHRARALARARDILVRWAVSSGDASP